MLYSRGVVGAFSLQQRHACPGTGSLPLNVILLTFIDPSPEPNHERTRRMKLKNIINPKLPWIQ